jgi:hypothetical protein
MANHARLRGDESEQPDAMFPRQSHTVRLNMDNRHEIAFSRV